MKTTAKIKKLVLLTVVVLFTLDVYATHAEGADITYKCLGGNQYEISVSFYRDCFGVNAPNTATVNCLSSSTGQNFNLVLQPIPGTGQEMQIVCSSAQTQCQGGTYPGVQEWIYTGVVTISAATDWIFSFDLCCRNAAITTIANPGGQNIHVEATLDNLNFPCNSSPVFSTKPVPFVCLNQNFTFNHGANDPDGDFITYELINPMNGVNSYVTYLPPYTPFQPLTTSPAMAFDTTTGDINMTATMLEVTVLSVKVKQWKNNQLVGYVIRDIQVRTLNCNNSYPYTSGISGSWSFVSNACVGASLNFDIYAYDPDSGQVITITWNNGIPGASFTVSPGPNPTGSFSWTPNPSDTGLHCFTITVSDDNCPINGKQTYSICLNVSGVGVAVTTTNANCGASNGSATALVIGGTGPYNYQWLSCGCASNPLHGLGSGSYAVMVTDAKGCTAVSSGTVNNGSAPGNTIMSSTSVTCFGANDGIASVNANGGQGPYTYLWSNGDSTQTSTGLAPGNYVVTVTTAQGCEKKDSVTIVQPVPLSTSISNIQDASCYNAANGSATANAAGGTAPYNYVWSNGLSLQSAYGLSSGTHSVTVTDAQGCTSVQSVFINQPAMLTLGVPSQSNVSCFGGNNGQASALASGGTAPYTYLWNTSPLQATQTAVGLAAGAYTVTVTDNNGCTALMPSSITEPAAISSTINSVSTSCFGSSTGTATVVSGGGTAPYTYLWNPSAAVTSTVTGLSAGTYSVLITDNNGCTHMNTTTVTQPAQLSASITNIQQVSCNNAANGSATANATGGTSPYQYAWSNGQATAIAAALDSGLYTVVISDANGCSATASVNITHPAAMVVTSSVDDSICSGQSAIISASSVGGTTPYTYFWQPNIGFGSSHSVSPGATTTYTAIVTDANGCTSTEAVTIAVYSNVFSISANTTPAICVGQTATVSASVSGNNISNYLWSHNLGTGSGPYFVSPSTTTTYSVSATNICGVSSIAAVTVVVNPLPQITIPPQHQIGCGNAPLHFSDSNPANNGSTYVWNFGDGSTSSQVNPIHSYYQTGVYTVGVTVTSPQGCSTHAQTTCSINVFPYPNANFTSDPLLETSIINPDFNFFDQSSNTTSWSWDFGDGQTSFLENPSHTYAQIGVYTVTLVTENAGGCIDSIVKIIEVKPEFTFYLPNTFSPNGDHINDYFTGKGLEIIEFEMSIFDRWGAEIFKTNDLNIGWDGSVKGGGNAIAQQDVYVYKVTLRDYERAEHVYHGHVNLIK